MLDCGYNTLPSWVQFGNTGLLSDKPRFATEFIFATAAWRGFLTSASAAAVTGDSSGDL